MIAAATASCSSTQRVATLEIETPCFAAIVPAAPQNALEGLPAAGSVDEALVFGAAPVGDVGRLGLAKPFVGEEAAAQRAVGEQLHALVAAERGKLAGGAAVDQREGHLVGGERHAVGQRQRADARRRNW